MLRYRLTPNLKLGDYHSNHPVDLYLGSRLTVVILIF
jgi:hypothetical protein